MKSRRLLQVNALLLLSIFVVTSGFSCKINSSKERELLEPVTLAWWGTFDDAENFSEIIADYTLLHPNIRINYRKLREEEFERELLDALAEDRGPDIISMVNSDIDKWRTKLEPLPPSTEMAYQITKTSLGVKEETTVEVRTNTSLTPAKLREQFLDVVYADVVRGGEIYGLPLTVDTLVMFFNRDLLNNAGLPLPPTTWSELQGQITRLTFQNREGVLVQSGAALGTANNVERGIDVLSLLMMQNGARMTQGNQILFHQLPPGADESYNPGPEALRFYTDFANPVKEVYTWNEAMPNSIDAFIQGKVAIIFGYNQHRQYIDARRQGGLNYEVISVPQIEGRPQINFARYPIHGVSKKSKYINEAWDFLQFASGQNEVKKYLTKTQRLTALRALVNEQINSDELRVFAQQLLTSTSWYHGNNAAAMETALKDMVSAVVNGTVTPEDAAKLAAQRIQQTL